MEKLPTTPSQTIGPFFAYSLTAEQYGYHFNSLVNDKLVNEGTTVEKICITGKVFDGEGNTIHDAMIELWQADANGKYITQYPNIPVSQYLNIPFKGFGRLGTGTTEDHSFTFKQLSLVQLTGRRRILM